MKRILICGDRNWTNYTAIENLVSKLPTGSVIIQGEANGADALAKHAGLFYGHTVESYPANWNEYGLAAGPMRNKQMLDEGKPDIVYAFHPNLDKSKGTRDMVKQAMRRGIEVVVVSG